MHADQTTYFVDEGKGPKVFIEILQDRNWPITIKINETGKRNAKPEVTIFIDNIKDLIVFKNSVIWNFEQAMKKYMEERCSNETLNHILLKK